MNLFLSALISKQMNICSSPSGSKFNLAEYIETNKEQKKWCCSTWTILLAVFVFFCFYFFSFFWIPNDQYLKKKLQMLSINTIHIFISPFLVFLDALIFFCTFKSIGITSCCGKIWKFICFFQVNVWSQKISK